MPWYLIILISPAQRPLIPELMPVGIGATPVAQIAPSGGH